MYRFVNPQRDFILKPAIALIVFFLSAPSLHADEQEHEILAVLDRYMAAVNRIDIEVVVETYHFPHFRLAKGKLTLWATPEEAMPMLKLPKEQRMAAMKKGLGPSWHDTRWAYQKLVSSDKDTAHVDTELVRYDSAGNELGRFKSLYILTREHDIWGIKGRSSFAPM